MGRGLAFALALAVCGDPAATPNARTNRLEDAIARDLSARAGGRVTARCARFAGIPLFCRAHLPDGSELAVRLADRHGELQWRVDDRIDTAQVQAYVAGVLADLGISQTARCPALTRERRIVCTLSGGGIAFVDVASTGQVSLELALDPAAAAARVAPPADRDLARMSYALQRLDDDDQEGDEPPRDGGAIKP